ncbi:MAG: High-affinity zinc uptake system ATP-binding protein ZnuC [Candidatus Erwinia impunctatus]|nr:High-affinity zinc uptake system ATP-binding protein ZnuC [Culicoides impunctatus]
MLQLNQLRVGYNGRPVTSPINGVFAPFTMTSITGVNGAGKSALLKTLAGLQPLIDGEIVHPWPASKIAWLPQYAEIDSQIPLSVFDMVATGCWPECGWFRGINRSMKQRIHSALESVGMAEAAELLPGSLSGGQLQRVLFARMLVQQADLLLLDEPFSAVDRQTTQKLIMLLKQLQLTGKTVLVVLHDHALIEDHFQQILSLDSCSEDLAESRTAYIVPASLTEEDA